MERIPTTPQREQPRISENSPFDRYCISSLSPLCSGERITSPEIVRSISPQILWPAETEEDPVKKPARHVEIKRVDIGVDTDYELKVLSIPVKVRFTTDDTTDIELPCIRLRKQQILSDPHKPSCACNNSKCLKFYCECFATNRYCIGCNCKNCMNVPRYESSRKKAYEIAIKKNPRVVQAKPEKEASRRCNCKNSGCLKKYCECFKSNPSVPNCASA